MSQTSSIKPSEGTELVPTAVPGVSSVRVVDKAAALNLPWDRYVRLQAVAKKIQDLSKPSARVLDVGGYDGALALFLDGFQVDVVDPDSTGGCATAIAAADRSYGIVASIDSLEHISPRDRRPALAECARVSSRLVLLNYPTLESMRAQELVLELTDNHFIRQHIDWPLPTSERLHDEMRELGYRCEVMPHTSVAIWLGQFVIQNLLPDAAAKVNKLLIQMHADEPFTRPLYHMLIAERACG